MPVTSPSYSVTAASSVDAVTVTNTPPSTSAGALTTYVVGFTTSATGALAGDTGSYASFLFPAGTTFTHLTSSLLKKGTTTVGFCQTSVTSLTVNCYLYGGQTVGASTAAVATLNGINNPSTSGSDTVKVTTTRTRTR